MLKNKHIEYHDGDDLLEGYFIYDAALKDKRPAVLVAHDWSGMNAFARHKAEKLAELGYVGFALDMYGKGKIGETKEEKTALMQPLMQDRAKLQKRIRAALAAVKKCPEADGEQIGAIGFCFGGLCVLDLARSGADVRGVVSIHGLLIAPDNTKEPIKAKILALHGFNDPMVKADQILEFGKEMTSKQVDWQFNIYGNAMHAFTNPEANDPDFGTVYNQKADARSWIAVREFFQEIF